MRRSRLASACPRILITGRVAGGATVIVTVPALGRVVASPPYAAVSVCVPAALSAPVGIVTVPPASVPVPSTMSPALSCTSPVGGAPAAATVTVTALPCPTVTWAGSAVAVVVDSRAGAAVRSRIWMLRNQTSSPLPWFCSPMCDGVTIRSGAVLVKSLISTPFRKMRTRLPSTRSS